MRAPSSIRIAGKEHRVARKPTAKLPDALGQFWADKALIEVRTKLDQFTHRDALVHEVMHAILATQGREYGEEVEEKYVNALATGLVGVLQDNPKFAQWLIEPIPKKPL